MTPFSWDRSRRLAAAAAVLTVIASCVGLLVLLVLAAKSGVPKVWWPHTGQAFATDTSAANQDPCDLIAGPGKAYCERNQHGSQPAAHPDLAGAAFRLAPAGAGVAALVVWRRRHATAQEGR